ncbi:MAG: branched-chain amino acid ABC transporter permease [Candidatus Bathyarchaeia archaeon]
MSLSLFLDILIGGLILGALYSLISVGLNLQYGVMRILNVAHGDFLMLGAYATYFCVILFGLNPFTSFIVVGPLMFSVGLMVYMIILRRVIKQSKSSEEVESKSLLLCFGLSFVIQNFVMIVWTANYRGYETPSLGTVNIFGTAFEIYRVLIAVISLVINIALYLYLKFTKSGLAMRAIVDNPEGAQLTGINPYNIYALSFSIGAMLSAFAGSLISTYMAISPFIGSPYTIIALVLIILAGIGSFKGNIVGGFIVGYLVYITLRLIHPALTLVIVYAALILILLLRPRGLFAR